MKNYEQTAIEMISDVAIELRGRDEDTQAQVLLACVDALYGGEPDTEYYEGAYKIAFDAIFKLAKENGFTVVP